MDIALVSNKADWRENTDTDLLQSWDYGEFLRSMGRDVRRFSISSDQVQCIYASRWGIPYVYAPRIAICDTSLIRFIQQLRDEGCAFLRIEPAREGQLVTAKYAVRPARSAQPQHVWMLDLSVPASVLLSRMHQKTRYNIRLAERHGVSIRTEKDFDSFWKLNMETTARNRYTNAPERFCRAILERQEATQLTAWHAGRPIAAAILFRYQDTMIYFYGASSTAGRHTMAPTMLQWHAIQYAQSAGCRWYDFLGIAEPWKEGMYGEAASFHGYQWNPDHPYHGVTRFKVGFPGFVRSYPPANDIVIRPALYMLYRSLSFAFQR